MTPIRLQEYIANASNLVIPSVRGRTVVNDILEEMRAVIDLTPQSSELEWDEHFMTAAVSGTQPQFTVAVQPLNAATHYHHISIQRVNNPDASANWFISVVYPGLALPIEVVNTNINEARMEDLLASKFSSAADTVVRNAQPLIVWPRGQLLIQRLGTIGAGESVRAQYVREVRGGPGTAEKTDDLTGGFAVP